jgi:kynurenine formamidase
MNNWGKWGKDDERGAVNYITPEIIVKAARLIRDGKTFSLAVPLDNTGPVFPSRITPFHTMVSTGGDFEAGVDNAGYGVMRFADDYIYMPLQGSTQWDALSHGWYGEQLYNGFPQSSIVSAPARGGARKLGIEKVRDSFIGRGVLIDLVRYKGGSLPKGYGISRADLEGALEKQGTRIETGDMVLLRTGVVPTWYANPDPAARLDYFNPQTGIVRDVVPWIQEMEIAAIAADNIGLERLPNPEDPATIAPLHGNILRDLGVYIGEIWWLEDLAADCEADGRYEFFLAAQPLNITGAVGSPLNPIAIK